MNASNRHKARRQKPKVAVLDDVSPHAGIVPSRFQQICTTSTGLTASLGETQNL